jgi:hypothetical protein
LLRGYELNGLSPDPIGEKDCPPVFAGAAVSTNTQISVDIKPLSSGELLKWKQEAGRSRCQLSGPNAVYGIVQVTSVSDIKMH